MKIYHDTDPLKKFREKMAEMDNLLSAADCDALDEKCEVKIQAAKAFAMESEYPDESEYLQYVYVNEGGENHA